MCRCPTHQRHTGYADTRFDMDEGNALRATTHITAHFLCPDVKACDCGGSSFTSLIASSRTESPGTITVKCCLSPKRKRKKRSLTEMLRQLTIPLDTGFFETLIFNVWSIIPLSERRFKTAFHIYGDFRGFLMRCFLEIFQKLFSCSLNGIINGTIIDPFFIRNLMH